MSLLILGRGTSKNHCSHKHNPYFGVKELSSNPGIYVSPEFFLGGGAGDDLSLESMFTAFHYPVATIEL